MKYGIYAIRDRKIGFGNPFYQHNDEVCLRTAKTALQKPEDNAFNMNPEDKELYKLGTFDDQDGKIKVENKMLCNLYQLKQEIN